MNVSSDLPALKAQLRADSLKRRNALDVERRIEFSLAACNHANDLQTLATIEAGTIVAGFNPIRSEIDPRPLMANLATKGAKLCLPVVTSKTTIEFRELVRGAEMVETGFGTFGPDETAAVLDPQILLVPLSVFDAKGGRIGYGAGYYDRAIERLIAKNITPTLFGMAYCLQQADSVPMAPHDRFLDAVITETGIITPKEFS